MANEAMLTLSLATVMALKQWPKTGEMVTNNTKVDQCWDSNKDRHKYKTNICIDIGLLIQFSINKFLILWVMAQVGGK